MKHLAIALLLSGVAAAQTPPKPHAFNDKFNLALFSADLLVRSLDVQSTRANLSNPCKCYKEDSLPMSIAGSTPKMLGYSIGMVGLNVGVAYLLHKTNHHRMERMMPMIDIGRETKYVANNYAIAGK